MSRAADDRVFKALAAPVRRALLDALAERPHTTGELCARFPALDRCTVMQHLTVLERARLIAVRRQGRERWNHLDPVPIAEIHQRWLARYAARAVQEAERFTPRPMEQPAPVPSASPPAVRRQSPTPGIPEF
jgi:DNA-binding transcriptional ArsR family regulator